MSTEQKLRTILEKYATDSQRMHLFNTAASRATSGKLDDQFTFGHIADRYVDQYGLQMNTEDYVEGKKILFGFFKDLAEKGQVQSMRYTAANYANGYNNVSVKKQGENATRIIRKPDMDKALSWAKKAEAKGDKIAKNIRMSIETRHKP